MLQIKNITKQYTNQLALDNVSFNIPPKEIFGLLGPNGAGKTTLLRIINQILPTDKGSVMIGDEKLQPKHIRKIGYLPEERGLYKKMPVEGQLLYLSQLRGLSHGEAKKQADYWLKKLFISDLKNKKLEQLSKGMQQKVQFIAAVIHKPELIILDEPFTGFDPVTAELIKENILELNQNGATIILSTHRMESVEKLCNSIVLINKSKKVLEGSVRDLKEAFKDSSYSFCYKGSLNHLLTNKGITILSKEVVNNVNQVAIKTNGLYTADQFLKDSLNEHIQLVSFNEIIPSMNDVFIKAVDLKN